MPKIRDLSRQAAAAAALSSIFLVAACGSSDSSDSGSSSSTDDAAAAVKAAPAGSFAGKKASGTPVKIGLMSPEGGTVIDEPDATVAAQAVVAYANDHLGGIGGHPIEIDLCKSLEDTASATACANQFVQNKDDGVVIVDTSQGHVVAPVITGAGLAYTSYAILGAELAMPNVYAWTGGVSVQLGAMAKAAKEAGATSLSLFVVDLGDVVAGIKQVAEPTFAAAGVKLKVVPIPPGTPDATSQVAAGVADGQGAIGIIGDGITCTGVLNGLTTAGFDGIRYVIQSCVAPSVVSAVGDAMKGAINLSWTDIESDADPAKLYRAIMAQYAPKTELNNFAPAGYQSMMGFVEAVNAGIGTTEPTPAGLLTAISKAKDVPLPIGGGIPMTCDGQQVPMLASICSNETLAQTLDAKGHATDLTIIK